MTSPVPDPPLISADAAPRVLCDCFLANADRGDNAANDELVRRMRAAQTCSVGPSSQTIAEIAVRRHRTRGVQ
ncbi:MAG: hypothetical protein M3228_15020 [Actinomycetota bacterium]|nr:hypothetical protein [Actinomycetota bacterium]